MKIKGFKAWRPNEKFVKDVASVPYDVVDYDQALELSKGNPLSFLHVVKQILIFLRKIILIPIRFIKKQNQIYKS